MSKQKSLERVTKLYNFRDKAEKQIQGAKDVKQLRDVVKSIKNELPTIEDDRDNLINEIETDIELSDLSILAIEHAGGLVDNPDALEDVNDDNMNDLLNVLDKSAAA